MSLPILTTEETKAPPVIQYMPAGRHIICATINGKPGSREVVADATACARLNADLAEMLEASAAGKRARPIIYFDHRPGEAAAYPKRFFWEEGKGIMLELESWSAAGRAAVEGHNYNYVSPAFRLSNEDGQVLGLIGGVEVASLVNDPAFQEIAPIVDTVAAGRQAEQPGVSFIGAAHCTPYGKEGEKEGGSLISTGGELENPKKTPHNRNTTPQTMIDELKKLLGLDENADEGAICAAVADLIKERDDSKKQAEEAQNAYKEKDEELQAARAAEKGAWLSDLKQRGVIAPQDEDAIQAASALFDAAPAAARTAYAKMPAADDSEIIQASHPTAASGAGENVEDFISFT